MRIHTSHTSRIQHRAGTKTMFLCVYQVCVVPDPFTPGAQDKSKRKTQAIMEFSRCKNSSSRSSTTDCCAVNVGTVRLTQYIEHCKVLPRHPSEGDDRAIRGEPTKADAPPTRATQSAVVLRAIPFIVAIARFRRCRAAGVRTQHGRYRRSTPQ